MLGRAHVCKWNGVFFGAIISCCGRIDKERTYDSMFEVWWGAFYFAGQARRRHRSSHHLERSTKSKLVRSFNMVMATIIQDDSVMIVVIVVAMLAKDCRVQS